MYQERQFDKREDIDLPAGVTLAQRIAIGGVTTLGALIWMNWLICHIVTAGLGGSAELSNAHGDQYFLVNHGRLTEVSRNTFWSVYWYALASNLIAVTFVIGATAAAAWFRWSRGR